ncbi:MAG: bis-aminopropyl spermidine synthase family protein [Deltaproteobacteria bacterium]
MDFGQLASEITERSQIPVSTRDIERVLGALKRTKLPWELADLADFPVPAVFESVKALEEKGFVAVSSAGFKLTSEGKRLAEGVPAPEDLSCEDCEGRGISIAKFAEVEERFLKIQKRRPPAIIKFDQGYVTPRTSVSRLALAYERGDVAGKDILLLGDDDLMSVVFGLSGLARSITVCEIDERIVNFIGETAAGEGFRVDVKQFDLHRPLPKEHAKHYDTFLCDPPETLKAAEAFIGRGIGALRSVGCAGYFGFTRREASLTKWRDVQKTLLKYGIVFTDILHNFNEYVNWDYAEETRAWRLAPMKVMPKKSWYRSALYRFETLEGFRGNSRDYGDENIYDDEESSTT